MNSPSSIVAKLGGIAETAAIVGVPYQTVAAWQARASIPLKYWGALIESDKGRSIRLTSETLMRANSKEGAAA